jgi:hypothetical protein
MLARMIKERAQRVEILSSARLLTELGLNESLDSGQVNRLQEIVRDAAPSEVNLPVGLGRRPPLAARAVSRSGLFSAGRRAMRS